MDIHKSPRVQAAHLLRAPVVLVAVLMVLAAPRPLLAQSGETGADIVETVNRYRVSQGMPALPVHPSLMLAAQRHAEWIAGNHRGSHVGEGGSMPDDRAAAAGYPGMARENVASGALNYISGEWAVTSGWANSQGHRLTMLADAEHMGAGTAWDSDTQYYVLLIGSTSGEGFFAIDVIMTGRQPAPGAAAPRSTGAGPTPTPTNVPVYVTPIQLAEPREDGSVVHVVQTGQTAWAIAAVYGVDVETLLAINGLKRPAILHPGDEIYVRLGPNVTPAPRDIRHVVAEGESAWTIAAMYHVTLDALMEANQLVRPVILRPGDTLTIPK